jgi:penicillin-binding protein 2
VFASFAPASDPRFVVDAVFEQSGYGASVAAPAAAEEYTSLFGLNQSAQQGSCAPPPSSTTTLYGASTSTTSTTVAGPPCSSTTSSTTTYANGGAAG